MPSELDSFPDRAAALFPDRAAALWRVVAILLSVAVTVLGCQIGVRNPVSGAVPEAECHVEGAITQSIYLVGDAGKAKLPEADEPLLVDPVLRDLQSRVSASVAALGANYTAVLYLGDNVYQRGLVAKDDPDRRRGERMLEAQILAAGEAWSVFTAGNHDWDKEGERGWDHVSEQRQFLRTQGRRVLQAPTLGCAGPTAVDYGPHLRFVFLDQIGWYHAFNYPEVHEAACPNDGDVRDIFLALSDEFASPDGRHVVLAMHHPLITAGAHGGNFRWQEHLFPLQEFVSWLWLPLPGIGSIYPLSRQLGVTTTDVTSGPYRNFINAIYRASGPGVPMLIAAGHEHSLQIHRDAIGMYYAVSGSASKTSRLGELPTQMMGVAKKGYMRLDSHENGSIELTVLALEDDYSPAQEIYKHCLANGPPNYERRRAQPIEQNPE